MLNRACIVNFSAPEIQIGILVDNQLEDIDLSLPWEVGFRQENDNRLSACFGDALEQLDPNHPAEVHFTHLDVHLKEITDEKTLQCLFLAFFEEIFHQLLPERGFPIDAMSVYAITPYQWTPTHRQEIRRALKRVKSDVQVSFLQPSTVTLRGILSQILCLSAYYQKAWRNILTGANRCHLFLIDFARDDFIVLQMTCSQFEDNFTVELTDMLRFSDHCPEIEEKIVAAQRVEDEQQVVVGFSGRTGADIASTIIESLSAQCRATFLEPQATLLGAGELVRQFEKKNLEKPLCFKYGFCYGVRLPDGKWVELVPKTSTVPYQRKKAFRVTESFEKFDVQLFCGLSLTDNSAVHHIATLEITPPENEKYTASRPTEFVLSVTLSNATHGTFAAHFPDVQEPKAIEFTVPVLMD